MLSRRSLIAAAALALLGLAEVPAARAEVAAETDAFGRYVRTSIFTQPALRSVKIWRVMRRNNSTVHALNPNGDRFGDLYPFVTENPRDGRKPLAVWSRFNGFDYDLVWSRWTNGAWSAIEWVASGHAQGDDVQPVATFDTTGRPFLAWWRDDEGAGSVYLSFMMQTRWSTPIRVSDMGVDSRSPRIWPVSANQVRVEYKTPSGVAVRVVTWNGPTTITDDITPVGNFSITPDVTQRGGW